MPKVYSFYEAHHLINRRWPKMPTGLYLVIVFILAMACLIATELTGSIILVMLSALNVLSVGGTNEMTVSSLTWVLIVKFLPLLLWVEFTLRFLENRGLRSMGMRVTGSIKKYFRGGIVGLSLFGGTVIGLSLLGYVTVENPLQINATAGALLILTGWIVQGAAEEVLTRGFLLQIFGRMTHSFVGITVSTLFFTVMHITNRGLNLVAILNLILFSLFAALFTLYERGLWGICAIHSIWNWAQGNLFGFQVSGHEIRASIVLDLREVGPDLWTGGVYGPEGGLVATIVLTIAIIAMIGTQRKDGHQHRNRNFMTPPTTDRY